MEKRTSITYIGCILENLGSESDDRIPDMHLSNIASTLLTRDYKGLEEHDAEIRRKAIEEFIDRFNKSTIIIGGRTNGKTFMLQCLNEIANQMKGESDGK